MNDTHTPPTIEIRRRADGAKLQRRELCAGLLSRPRSIPSKYFYDERGAALFERITRLPEYYQTRAERAILERHADEIANGSRAGRLVEIGAGSADKTRLLLDALTVRDLRSFVAVDVDETTLRQTVESVAEEYPGLDVHGVVADFTAELGSFPGSGDPTLAAFLGGTIGNLEPTSRAPRLVASLAATLEAGDALLLGVDLIKDRDVVERAYNDSDGITAEFNRNILRNVNRVLDADFDPYRFTHRAFYDADNDWIEMRLVSDIEQTVRLAAVDESIALDAGEEILTEISAKYDRGRTERLLAGGDFELEVWLTDDDRFALALARSR